MKLNYLVVLLSATLVHTQAHSTQVSQPNQQSSTASASSTSAATASAKSTAVGLGLGVGVGLGGNAVGGNAVSAGGNAISAGGNGGSGGTGGGGGVGNGGVANLTYVEAASTPFPRTVTIKNTPDVSIVNIAPTSPCMGGTSVGGSGPGFGLAFGTSWKDSDCSLRETARSFTGLGLIGDAIAILCSSEYAAAAPSCKALKARVEEESR